MRLAVGVGLAWLVLAAASLAVVAGGRGPRDRPPTEET